MRYILPPGHLHYFIAFITHIFDFPNWLKIPEGGHQSYSPSIQRQMYKPVTYGKWEQLKYFIQELKLTIFKRIWGS